MPAQRDTNVVTLTRMNSNQVFTALGTGVNVVTQAARDVQVLGTTRFTVAATFQITAGQRLYTMTTQIRERGSATFLNVEQCTFFSEFPGFQQQYLETFHLAAIAVRVTMVSTEIAGSGTTTEMPFDYTVRIHGLG